MKILKHLLIGILIYSILSNSVIAQNNKGIHFQAIARNENGIIIPNKQINIRISILSDSGDGKIEYQEIKSIKTNMLGLFFISIGSEEMGKVVTIGKFDQINWSLKSYYFQVDMDPNNSLSFINVGVEKMNYVPLAFYAEKANMVEKIVPVELGGTGVGNLKDISKLLSIDKLNNTPDSLKPMSIPMSLALNEKLNKGDTLKMSNRINLKLNASDTNLIFSKINAIAKIDTSSLSNRINNKINAGAISANDIIGGLGFVPVKSMFGIFYDTSKQVTTINTATSVKFSLQQGNNTLLSNKINITNNSTGNPTRIMVGDMGVFQINYQLQLTKTDQGNDEVNIWIRRNSSAYPNTNSTYVIQGGGIKNIFSGNYFIELGANDYVELFYSVKNINSVVYGSPASTVTPSRPATPSAYLTIHSIN
jgi:hypothetical protein